MASWIALSYLYINHKAQIRIHACRSKSMRDLGVCGQGKVHKVVSVDALPAAAAAGGGGGGGDRKIYSSLAASTADRMA